MKRMNGWKRILAFTLALSLSVPAATYFTSGAELAAQAEDAYDTVAATDDADGSTPPAVDAEAVSENNALLAYLNELCTSKSEDNEYFQKRLFSEKALAALKSCEETFLLSDTLRGVTAKGNTNSFLTMKADDYEDELGFYMPLDDLFQDDVLYVLTEEEYQSFFVIKSIKKEE